MALQATQDGYAIDFDPMAERLSLRLEGFWNDATADAFGTALREQIAAILKTTSRFDTLSDATAFPVQSASVSTKFGSLMYALGTARHGRIAVVVASTLNKLQAERALGNAVAVFLDRCAACAWLDRPPVDSTAD